MTIPSIPIPSIPVDLTPARRAGVCGLSGLQILFHLYQHGSTSPSALARSAGVTPSAITTAIDSLVNRHLVSISHSSKSDRRAKLASITPAGTELVSAICLPSMANSLGMCPQCAKQAHDDMAADQAVRNEDR